MADTALPALIGSLCDPARHGHPPGGVVLLQTHISWVLLAGASVYKLKKPVDFGFLDFSTLALRRHYCEEELRLNGRLAPQLYRRVVAITGTPENPVFDGDGEVLEYAVELKRFAEADLAANLIREARMNAGHIDGLARTLAAFHGGIGRSTAQDGHGLPESILATAEHNFDLLLPTAPSLSQREEAAIDDSTERLEALLAWTRNEYARCREAFLARKQAGFVRECHGDLHLGNIVLIDDQLTPFDGIEFSEDLRWVDVISEMAFLFMDLEVHEQGEFAWRLLNRYVELTGDYEGLELLGFYRVYRAMVRVKVAMLNLESAQDTAGRRRLEAQCRQYLDYAGRATQAHKPILLITHGFSGSGKSHLASRLAERLPAIRIASDVERKRLAGFAADARTRSEPGGGIYTEAFSRQTYARLQELAERLLQARMSVILDATYLKSSARQSCRELAEKLGAGFLILDMQVPVEVLRERIGRRLEQGTDPSEADQTILTLQMAHCEPLDEWEKLFTLAIDASKAIDPDEMLRVWR
ncbi:MAG: AAA family ATPase [Methylococcaceae bacterium]|nr:AAA family ATPase [Methylococcaceae bacterium]